MPRKRKKAKVQDEEQPLAEMQEDLEEELPPPLAVPEDPPQPAAPATSPNTVLTLERTPCSGIFRNVHWERCTLPLGAQRCSIPVGVKSSARRDHARATRPPAGLLLSDRGSTTRAGTRARRARHAWACLTGRAGCQPTPPTHRSGSRARGSL